MVTVDLLIRFVEELRPHSDTVKLALHNYLKYALSPKAAVTPELLNGFFCQALVYPHWQQSADELGRQVRSIMERVVSLHGQDFAFDEVLWPHRLELLEFRQIQTVEDVVIRFLSKRFADVIDISIRRDMDKRVVAFLERPEGYTVYSFDKKMCVRDGQLEPLRLGLKVDFGADFALKTDCEHSLEVSPYVQARMITDSKNCRALFFRGYVFQKFHEIELPLERLFEDQKVFFPLKRLESFWVERGADPLYTKICEDIGLALKGLELRRPMSKPQAQRVVERAQQLVDHVFGADKQLIALTKDLKLAIRLVEVKDASEEGQWISENASTN